MLKMLKKQYDVKYIKREIKKFGERAGVDLSDVSVSIKPVVEKVGVKGCATCNYETDDISGEIIRTWNYGIEIAEEVVCGIMDKQTINNIIGHEVAHIILYMEDKPKAYHNDDFVAKCLEIGVDKEFTGAGANIKVQNNPTQLKKFGYRKIYCKQCKTVADRTNSIKRTNDLIKNHICGKCGGELVYNRY